MIHSPVTYHFTWVLYLSDFKHLTLGSNSTSQDSQFLNISISGSRSPYLFLFWSVTQPILYKLPFSIISSGFNIHMTELDFDLDVTIPQSPNNWIQDWNRAGEISFGSNHTFHYRDETTRLGHTEGARDALLQHLPINDGVYWETRRDPA